MTEDTRLSVGGSVGAIKGNLFEQHFKKVLTQLGYIILPYSLIKKYLKNDGSIEVGEELFRQLKSNLSINEITKKIIVWRYRLPPYGFSEIDFYVPSIKIGFWVSYIGRIKRKTCPNCFAQSKATKFNEFAQSEGTCPHCGKGILPNKEATGVEKWICNVCHHMVDPLTLNSIKCALCGGELIEIEDRSASTQAHKQFYYRLAELLDIKTKLNITCIFVAYNTREEWRIWNKAFDLFFDCSIFVFDREPIIGGKSIQGIFDSDKFNSQFSSLIANILKNPPQISDKRVKQMFAIMKKIRDEKEKLLEGWKESIIISRKTLIKSSEIKCYPIRYSIYYLLKKLKECYPPIISSNQYEDVNVDEQTLQKRERIILSEIDNINNENAEDLWLNFKREIVKRVLTNYFERAKRHRWYKNLMLLNLDYKAINATPFLKQFEPLEELLFVKLNQINKDKNIIKKIEKEPCFDVAESTVLRKLIGIKEGDRGFIIGNDARILLSNDREVVFQCKTSCSFEKWDETGKIISSGISYKDAKRMIGHNFLASFDLNDKVKRKERVFIVVIDGHWGAGKGDELKNLSIMYLLGVDEIFFADELFNEEKLPSNRRFTEYLLKLASNKFNLKTHN